MTSDIRFSPRFGMLAKKCKEKLQTSWYSIQSVEFRLPEFSPNERGLTIKFEMHLNKNKV